MGAVWVLMQHYGEHTTQEYTAVALALALAIVTAAVAACHKQHQHS